MVEKLPLDFVRKIYNMLTNGNDDVNFYCMCIQNQNREAATNSPIKFALNLIKINILCRLPFSKQKLFSEEIGKAYLSGIFVRPAICELASGMLDNSRLITDIFGCAVTTIKNRNDIFKDIQKEIGVKGFADLRKQYDNSKLPIQQIYKKISAKLKTVIDYKIELSVMEKYYVANKYAVRLLDIAACNNVFITAIIRSGYPREFIEKILKKYKISVDRLIITSEGETDIKNETLVNPEFTGVFSNDYKGFIKKFMKYGCKPIYYRSPQALMERTVHPKLSDDFRNVYDGICGLNLFSGIKRMSKEYELSFLCIAPAVAGFAQRVTKRIDKGEFVICLCDESSFFARLIKRLCKNNENIVFFPWSPLTTNKCKSALEWKEIIEETPIFDDAYSGVFDCVLRYPVSSLKAPPDTLTLSGIMATAWTDKSSDGVDNAIRKVIGKHKRIVIADPVPGICATSQLCGIVENTKPETIYTCVSMSNMLRQKNNDLKPLAKIMQGNMPLLCQIGTDGKKWIYPKKIDNEKLDKIYRAILDFSLDFFRYTKDTSSELTISGDDASALYMQGLSVIRNMI
ncbi:hypothetical protein [Ruminococcus sp.]|uniref:hypothetical protein n=1 Tax=Ruminococcus sp. TaxID=41978 RepID=UPI003F026F42